MGYQEPLAFIRWEKSMLRAEGISPKITTPPLNPTSPGATVRKTPEARVKEMAREFEATFLSMLLKEMRQTLEPDGGLFPGDSGDVQGGLFDSFLSRHLAASGGVGLAAVLERQIRPPAGKSEIHPDVPHHALPPGGFLA